MEPTTVAVVEVVGPWYQKLAQEVGPLAATLFLFLGAFGWLGWKISIRVLDAWHVESLRHQEETKSERTLHRSDIDSLVDRLDERDKFQREELSGLARAYEKNAVTQIAALDKVELVLHPLNENVQARPCLLHDQKREILNAARTEAIEMIRNLEGNEAT